MNEQEIRDLEYLRHALLNGVVALAHCCKEIEKIVGTMATAVAAYKEDHFSDKSDR